jgi:hypothetical protein
MPKEIEEWSNIKCDKTSYANIVASLPAWTKFLVVEIHR